MVLQVCKVGIAQNIIWTWCSVAMEEGIVFNPINLGEWRGAGLADGNMNG